MHAAHAVLAHNSLVRFHPYLYKTCPDDTQSPALYAPVSNVTGNTPAERLFTLSTVILSQFFNDLPQNCVNQKLGVLLLLPGTDYSRGAILAEPAWHADIEAALDLPPDIQLIIRNTNKPFSYWVDVVDKELQRDSVDTIVVVCADSLIDPVTLNELAHANRLSYRHQDTGYIPGEGAALFTAHKNQPTEAFRLTTFLSTPLKPINQWLNSPHTLVMSEATERKTMMEWHTNTHNLPAHDTLFLGQIFGDLGIAGQAIALTTMMGLMTFDPKKYTALCLVSKLNTPFDFGFTLANTTENQSKTTQALIDPLSALRKKKQQDLMKQHGL